VKVLPVLFFNIFLSLINGKKLDAKKMSYLNNIGYVGQDSRLIHGTLKQNIIFGNPKKETNEISLKKLIKDVGLSDFYRKLDNGFDTLIENEGKKISGGEK
jgi:ABC-type multidrug transport system fused ATPase/permease subunit